MTRPHRRIGDVQAYGGPGISPGHAFVLELTFEKGNCVAIDGKPRFAGRNHPQAQQDSRGTRNRAGRLGGKPVCRNEKPRSIRNPGGTVLLHAHRQLETLTMDRDLMHLRDSLIPRYGELIYYGFWYAPRGSPPGIDRPKPVHDFGTVRLKLYKGGITTVGRKSEYSFTTRALPPWTTMKAITNRRMRVDSSASTR